MSTAALSTKYFILYSSTEYRVLHVWLVHVLQVTVISLIGVVTCTAQNPLWYPSIDPSLLATVTVT